MNLITAVGFENVNFEMYLSLWPCEQVCFSTWPLQHRSLYFEQRDTVRSILVSCFWGGKKSRKTQPCGMCVNSFWIAGGAAPLPRVWVPGQSCSIPAARRGGAPRGWAVAVLPQSSRPRLQSELGEMGKSAQSLKLDQFLTKVFAF